MAKPLERALKWLLPVLVVIEIVLVWTGCLDRDAAIDPGYEGAHWKRCRRR